MAAVKVNICAIRHGPTQWNVEKRIQGNVDTDILPEKILHYFETLQVNKISQPDIIILSKMKRAEQTAQALIDYMNWPDIPMHKENRLNERSWGIFEGVLDAEAKNIMFEDAAVRANYPRINNLEDVIKMWDAEGFKAHKGESINEVSKRVTSGLSDIVEQYVGKNILFVSHAGVLISLGLDHKKISQFTLSKDKKNMHIKNVRYL